MATKFNDPRFQPSAGMCQTCQKKNQNCSGLPFAGMPVIEASDYGKVRIVRCTQHKPATTPPAP